MQKFLGYLSSVKMEMSKVTWPTKDEVVATTTLVVVFAIVVALFVWGCDKASNSFVYDLITKSS